jgi:WD40 repeat protein
MPVLAARFAPEGRELITGNAANSVDVWSYATPQAVNSLAGHEGAVYGVAFSPDGTVAASCGADKTVRIWNLETGELAKQLTGHTGAVYSLRFDAAGGQIVTSSADGTVRIWNIASGQATKTLAAEVAEGETAMPLFDAAISPNGQLIAATGSDKSIRVWTVANGQLAQTITGHEDAIYRIDFSADSAKLISIGHAGNLYTWNPANGQPIATAKLPAVSYSGAFSPSEPKATVVCSDQKAYIIAVP